MTTMTRRSLFRAGGITALAGFGAAAMSAPALAAPGEIVTGYKYQAQSTPYNCGPTAGAMCLSAKGVHVSADELGRAMKLTTEGTTFGNVAPALTQYIKRADPNASYTGQWIDGNDATPQQVEEMWNRFVKNAQGGFGSMCNWWVPAGKYPGAPDKGVIYHYVAVVGVNTDNHHVLIADSARFHGNETYWLPKGEVATFCAGRGYFW